MYLKTHTFSPLLISRSGIADKGIIYIINDLEESFLAYRDLYQHSSLRSPKERHASAIQIGGRNHRRYLPHPVAAWRLFI